MRNSDTALKKIPFVARLSILIVVGSLLLWISGAILLNLERVPCQQWFSLMKDKEEKEGKEVCIYGVVRQNLLTDTSEQIIYVGNMPILVAPLNFLVSEGDCIKVSGLLQKAKYDGYYIKNGDYYISVDALNIFQSGIEHSKNCQS